MGYEVSRFGPGSDRKDGRALFDMARFPLVPRHGNADGAVPGGIQTLQKRRRRLQEDFRPWRRPPSEAGPFPIRKGVVPLRRSEGFPRPLFSVGLIVSSRRAVYHERPKEEPHAQPLLHPTEVAYGTCGWSAGDLRRCTGGIRT